MGIKGMNLTKEQLKIGEFYHELLEETNCYHVFHTEAGDFSSHSYAGKEEADRKVNELNNDKI